MSRGSTMGRWSAAALFLSLLAAPVAWAQESDEPMSTEQKGSSYFNGDDAWKERRFLVSGFAGGMVGGTAVGLVENLVMRSQFEIGSDTLIGGRVGWVLASHFDVELEYGRSSPGLNAILTDLQGQGKTEFPFADVDVSYVMASVNYAVIDRTRRVVPYLSLGIGAVHAGSPSEDRIGNTEAGIVYGGGLRVRLIDMLAVRADVRGMRSGFGTKQDTDGQTPGVFVNDFNASFLLWSAGLELRF